MIETFPRIGIRPVIDGRRRGISSAGLRLIVALQKQADETGHTLVIRNINKVVSEIFRETLAGQK